MISASLLLCHRLPYPPNKGDKIRSYELLKHLAARGPVHLACFIDDPGDLKYRDEVARLAGGKCIFVPIGRLTKWSRAAQALLSGQPVTTAYFASPKIHRWVSEVLASEPVERTIVFGSAMAPYLMHDRARAGSVLFDMVDVDSDKWRQYATWSTGFMRWIYAREARTVAALERAAAAVFGKTLLVSEYEAETFRQMAPESAARIGVLGNGVDLARFSPGAFKSPFPSGEAAVVMTGHMDYRPNADGALWFAREVAPHLFASLSNAHVYFVGSNPPPALRKVQGPRITVTGMVDDVRPYIQGAASVVAPLLIARGVQNKVLEAMAMGKPVVATHEATRALDVHSGRELFIENDPRRFADAVAAAIENPLRDTIARNARQYIEQNHDWKTIMSSLDDLLDQLARDARPRSPATIRPPVVGTGACKPDFTGAKA